MSPAKGPSPLPERFGASLLSALPRGLLTCPRAESSALLMYCNPVATLYTVTTRLVATRVLVAPAPATDTDASTHPTTATRKAVLPPESGPRTALSLRLLIRRSLPAPQGPAGAAPGPGA